MGSTRAERITHHWFSVSMLVAGTCKLLTDAYGKLLLLHFFRDQTAKMHVYLISNPVLFIQNPFLLRLLVVSLC